MDPTVGRALFIGLVLIIAASIFILGVRNLLHAHVRGWNAVVRTSIVLALLATAGFMSLTWLTVQRGEPDLDITALSRGSSAAIIGDPFFLTPAIVTIALGWREKMPKWACSGWWMLFSGVVATALGFIMHGLGGDSDSQSADLGVRLHDSATSWAHNLGVVPAVAGILIFGLVPLVANPQTRWRHATIATLLIGGWLALTIVDGQRAALDPNSVWYFDPHWLDTQMNWSKWAPA